MKRLGILRHAKSSWDHPGTDDFDRPLNERGWKAARRMGREFKHRAIGFDQGFASPAARVRETLDGLTETYGELPFPLAFDHRLYLASVDMLMALVRGLPEDAGSTLLVGHNPGLQELILTLSTGDGGELRARVTNGYPTAAFASIELKVARWADVAVGSGEIADLILPRELD